MVPDDELLTKIHKVSLYILLAFDKVCRENDLTYFLDSGTALGAVRHGGFIPWDDDIDVGMPRKDYERFLRIGQKKFPEYFFIQTTMTDPFYNHNFAKIRLKGTVFQEHKDLPYLENGFFIDIFPFDNVPKNKCLASMNVLISRLYFRVISAAWGRKEAKTGFRRFIQKIIQKIPQSHLKWLNDKYLRFCRKHEDENTGFMTCYLWRMSQYKTYIFDTKRMLPTKDINFEGKSLKIMQDADYYLKLMYGAYMELPPISERHGHHLAGMIDFGTFF